MEPGEIAPHRAGCSGFRICITYGEETLRPFDSLSDRASVPSGVWKSSQWRVQELHLLDAMHAGASRPAHGSAELPAPVVGAARAIRRFGTEDAERAGRLRAPDERSPPHRRRHFFLLRPDRGDQPAACSQKPRSRRNASLASACWAGDLRTMVMASAISGMKLADSGNVRGRLLMWAMRWPSSWPSPAPWVCLSGWGIATALRRSLPLPSPAAPVSGAHPRAGLRARFPGDVRLRHRRDGERDPRLLSEGYPLLSASPSHGPSGQA